MDAKLGLNCIKNLAFYFRNNTWNAKLNNKNKQIKFNSHMYEVGPQETEEYIFSNRF